MFISIGYHRDPLIDEVGKAILRKLLYDNRIGAKHISLENLKKDFRHA